MSWRRIDTAAFAHASTSETAMLKLSASAGLSIFAGALIVHSLPREWVAHQEPVPASFDVAVQADGEGSREGVIVSARSGAARGAH